MSPAQGHLQCHARIAKAIGMLALTSSPSLLSQCADITRMHRTCREKNTCAFDLGLCGGRGFDQVLIQPQPAARRRLFASTHPPTSPLVPLRQLGKAAREGCGGVPQKRHRPEAMRDEPRQVAGGKLASLHTCTFPHYDTPEPATSRTHSNRRAATWAKDHYPPD